MSHKRDFSDMQIISRDEALALGLTEFFTGEPCPNGHVAPRSLTPSQHECCVTCRNDAALRAQTRRRQADIEAFRKARRLAVKRDPIGQMLRQTKSRARVRGIEFAITRADLDMNNNCCPCCGKQMFIDETANGAQPHSPSIDRLRPHLGYVPGNVNVICWRCNDVKRGSTIEELRTVLRWMESALCPSTKIIRINQGDTG